MKLLTKYNRISIVVIIIVLLASSICYYFILRYSLINLIDQDLEEEEQEVINYVRSNNALPAPSNYDEQQVFFRSLNGNSITRSFSDIKSYNNEEKEKIPMRQLVFPIIVAGKNFEGFILKSEEETEDLIQIILLITFCVVILLLIVIFLINRFLLNELWKPFNTTLREIKKFNPSTNKELQLEDTSINEFAELNHVVKMMAGRVNLDYDSLKAFTENASHEIQTPLAIINSKLDILIQDDSINANQMQQLQDIYSANNKLSSLTQSLLLLTKIENNHFDNKEDIRIDILVKEKIIQFEELAHSNNITVTTNFQNTTINCNKYLTEILISNLYNNAIRYNKKDGIIVINIIDNRIVISNSSAIVELDKGKVFKRFYRHSDSKIEGNGLGLSIVKQICDITGYRYEYSYQNGFHEFSIFFMPS